MNSLFTYRFSHPIQGVKKTYVITPIIGKLHEKYKIKHLS